MTYPAYQPRPVVLRAKRDTIVLVLAATTLTFALSHVVHRHQASVRQALSPPTAAQKAWTGGLAEVAPSRTTLAAAEPLTSASLVVSKSEFALPEPKLGPLVKLRGCDKQACVAKSPTVPLPVRRAIAANDAAVARGTIEDDDEAVTPVVRRAVPHRTKPSLMSRLNPLNHLPDASTIKRPFAIAGDAMTGWFKRF